MRILGLDTATSATTAAFLDTEAGIEVAARDDPPPGVRPRHTTELIALLVDVLGRAGAEWSDVDRIAIGVGPGTFTGLRIGVATGRALARAHGIAAVGISTLQSLALGASAAAPAGVVLPVLDARRGEVFTAAWSTPSSAGGPWRPLLEPLAVAPERLAELAPGLGENRLAIGDGSLAFRAVLERSGTVIPEDDSELHRVSAINHCRLAGVLSPPDRDGIRPHYLRLPDAELARRASQPT